MARVHIVMDENVSMSQSGGQPNNFAVPIGVYRNGVAYVRLFKNTNDTNTFFRMLKSMDRKRNDAYWELDPVEVVAVGPGVVGLFKFNIASPGMFMRWHVSGLTGPIVAVFSIDLFMNLR